MAFQRHRRKSGTFNIAIAEKANRFAFWVNFFRGAGMLSDFEAKYAQTFEENRIKPDMVMDLTKEFLRDMEITAVGDVIAIIRHAKKTHEENLAIENAKRTRREPDLPIGVAASIATFELPPIRIAASTSTSVLPPIGVAATAAATSALPTTSSAASAYTSVLPPIGVAASTATPMLSSTATPMLSSTDTPFLSRLLASSASPSVLLSSRVVTASTATPVFPPRGVAASTAASVLPPPYVYPHRKISLPVPQPFRTPPEDVPLPYPCEKCGARFRNPHSRNLHQTQCTITVV